MSAEAASAIFQPNAVNTRAAISRAGIGRANRSRTIPARWAPTTGTGSEHSPTHPVRRINAKSAGSTHWYGNQCQEFDRDRETSEAPA